MSDTPNDLVEPDDGLSRSSVDGPSASLSQRAADLRAEAIQQIKQARADKADAEQRWHEAEGDERDAVHGAVELGIPRKDIAEAVGVSVSWVANMLRRETYG